MYLSDFARGEVPDLNETVHRASHQVLTIRGESGTLHMRLLSKLSREEKQVTSEYLKHSCHDICDNSRWCKFIMTDYNV